MERILLNKCKEQLIIMTLTKKERGKITVKNKLGGWVATKICWPAMLLARLNILVSMCLTLNIYTVNYTGQSRIKNYVET